MIKIMMSILVLAVPGLSQCSSRQPQDIAVVYDPPMVCDDCAEWNQPQEPFRVFSNVYYVGTKGLSSILITGKAGHVLIGGALTQSAPIIEKNIEKLGYSIKDVRLILNSHAHYDHVGGLAALQRHSGAIVAASAPSADAFLRGNVMDDDPQYGFGPQVTAFPPITDIDTFVDKQVLHVGDISLTAHYTPGHTPGGTSWTWRSCEGGTCLNIAYADSLSAVSAPGYRFTDHQELLDEFYRSLARVAQLPCDIMLTTHPVFFKMAEKAELARQNPLDNPFFDPSACAAYAAKNKSRLDKRLAKESQP